MRDHRDEPNFHRLVPALAELLNLPATEVQRRLADLVAADWPAASNEGGIDTPAG